MRFEMDASLRNDRQRLEQNQWPLFGEHVAEEKHAGRAVGLCRTLVGVGLRRRILDAVGHHEDAIRRRDVLDVVAQGAAEHDGERARESETIEMPPPWRLLD